MRAEQIKGCARRHVWRGAGRRQRTLCCPREARPTGRSRRHRSPGTSLPPRAAAPPGFLFSSASPRPALLGFSWLTAAEAPRLGNIYMCREKTGRGVHLRQHARGRQEVPSVDVPSQRSACARPQPPRGQPHDGCLASSPEEAGVAAPQLREPRQVARDGGVALLLGLRVVDHYGADGAREARHAAQPSLEPLVDAARVEEVAARREASRLLPLLEASK